MENMSWNGVTAPNVPPLLGAESVKCTQNNYINCQQSRSSTLSQNVPGYPHEMY